MKMPHLPSVSLTVRMRMVIPGQPTSFPSAFHNNLTSPAPVLPSFPPHPVPSTAIFSIAAAATTTFSTTFSAVTSTTVNPSQKSPQQSIQPTSSAALSPTVIYSSGLNSNKRLAIGLGIGIPFLCALIVFISWWQRTRYVEKKRVDEFVENVEWMTPRPRTGATARTAPRTTPATPAPTVLDNLNGVERAVAEDMVKKSAEFEQKRVALGSHPVTPPRFKPARLSTITDVSCEEG